MPGEEGARAGVSGSGCQGGVRERGAGGGCREEEEEEGGKGELSTETHSVDISNIRVTQILKNMRFSFLKFATKKTRTKQVSFIRFLFCMKQMQLS